MDTGIFGNTGECRKNADGGYRGGESGHPPIGRMIAADIEAEKGAIEQYRMHMKMMNDCYVNAVLARIIKDEEYHIMLLRTLMQEIH